MYVFARHVRNRAVERARRARRQVLSARPFRVGERVQLLGGGLGEETTGIVDSALADNVETETRAEPHIELEEVDGDEVVLRVAAVPVDPSEGQELANDVLASLQRVSRQAA